MVLQPVPRDGAPAHAAWRAWWRVSPAPRPTTTVPAADPAGRPDLTEKEASRLMLQFRKLVGDHHPHAPHPGRIRVPGRPRRGHSARKELLATPCQPIKGVTILPFGFGKHKVPVRRLPATMNKYGFLASVGRTGVCYDNAAADIIQRHPRRKELVNQQDLPHQKKSNQRSWHHGLNTDCDQIRLHSSLGYRTPNEVHQEWRKTKTAA